MGAGDLTEPPVALSIVFERFPASLRGALVVRGADPNPHQGLVEEASFADLRTPSRPAGELGIDGVTVDVRPRGEVVIPFEVVFGELGGGWYAIRATVLVDGQQRVKEQDPELRFVVPWPRELLRRGTIPVDARIEVPGTKGAVIDRVECKADRALVRWSYTEEGEQPPFGGLRVLADGKVLPTLETTQEAGEATTAVYPVLKEHAALRFELDRHVDRDGTVERGRWSVDATLP